MHPSDVHARGLGRRPAPPVIRAACLGVAILLASPASSPSTEESSDPALIRLAEQSGCSGKPIGYRPGYFSPDDAASGVFWCRRGERYAEDGRVGEQWVCHRGACLVRVYH